MREIVGKSLENGREVPGIKAGKFRKMTRGGLEIILWDFSENLLFSTDVCHVMTTLALVGFLCF